MTDTPNRPPLWRVMDTAIAEAQMDARATSLYAAEIRAVRDWLVPDGQEPSEHLFDGDSNPQWDRWKERQRLRALLTAEADRAERGE
jgi:hypothetical protein